MSFRLFSIIFLTALFSCASWATTSCRGVYLLNPPLPLLFEGRKSVQINLSSDFSALAKKIKPQYGEDVGESKKSFFPGTLQIENQALPIQIRGSGSTSAEKEESSFPKLKLKLSDAATKTTQLEGIHELYINTHLRTDSTEKWSPRGRLVNGDSPFREALAYDVAKMLGLETGGYRRAWIQYEDVRSKQEFKRQALLIESHESVAQRLQSKEVPLQDFMNLEIPNSEEIALPIRVHLFQALIGNQDFGFDLLRKASPTLKFAPLKNIAVLKKKDGRIIPLVYDFDVATFVTGYDSLYPWHSNPEFGIADRSLSFTFRNLFLLRTEFYEKDLRPELDRVLEKIPQLEKMIDQAEVDPEGKANAKAHLAAFTKAAALIYDPSLLFIQGKKIQFYELPNGRKSKMQESAIYQTPGTLRPGTPFRILEEAGDYLKIVIYDIRFDLKSGQSPIGYIKKKSQFGSTLLQETLPVPDVRDFH